MMHPRHGDRDERARRAATTGGLLYRLLVGRETGPRLPTLLLAIGADRVGELLALPDK
jgi:lysyl-tRNA synthetase class I